MNCPICGKKLTAMVCDCGYDRSRDYEKYPTFAPVLRGVESIAVLRDRLDNLVRCGRGQVAEELKKAAQPTIVSIETGKMCTMILWSNGAVTAVGDWFITPTWGKQNWKDPENLIGELKDVKSVVLPKSSYGMVALKKDGTVLAVNSDGSILRETGCWRNIVAVSVCGDYADTVVGLKKDGTVVVAGDRWYSTKFDVSNWRDIVAISVCENHIVGLKKDGTVVATGEKKCDVSHWRDITAVAMGDCVVGLKKDGTVVVASEHWYSTKFDVSNWRDIVAISVCKNHIVGLKKDGTVVATGDKSSGKCDVSHWRDVNAIFTGESLTVGLKKNGTVMVAGSNVNGRRRASKWDNIVAVSVGFYHIVGMKKDGTLVAVGDNSKGQCDVHKLMKKVSS